MNRTNPIGMKGHMAKCYGDLIQELWSGTQKNIAPLKLRWTIAKYAPRFNGFQQQDSQELLAFLLDGLHEDLNRVHDKPYVELKDSNGRPDWEVAAEVSDFGPMHGTLSLILNADFVFLHVDHSLEYHFSRILFLFYTSFV
uniref:ubiquitinyl hydrolase 1 n=1 Tax=Micrurus spixii TaxID=129469 RepID=A0A2D4MBZ3_9SAUR